MTTQTHESHGVGAALTVFNGLNELVTAYENFDVAMPEEHKVLAYYARKVDEPADERKPEECRPVRRELDQLIEQSNLCGKWKVRTTVCTPVAVRPNEVTFEVDVVFTRVAV